MKTLHKLIVTSVALASLLFIDAVAQEPMGANMNGSKCAFQKNCNKGENAGGFHTLECNAILLSLLCVIWT